ncbi:MAG: MFS transporter [Bellilinea sp.]
MEYGKPTRRVVLINAALMRIYYLPLILLPVVLTAPFQIWLIIVMAFLMSIPGTGVQVGFTVLFGEAVPEEWRAYVAGTRNAIFAVVCILTALVSGFILKSTPFPGGYQIVFAVGFVGAALSVASLYFVRPLPLPAVQASEPAYAAGDSPDGMLYSATLREGHKQQASLTARDYHARLRFDIVKSPYNKVLLLIFAFHLTQYLPLPLFPILSVKILHLPDQTISIGSALFYLFMFMASTRMPQIAGRFGYRRTTGIGLISLANYPIFLAVAQDEWLYLAASIFGGTGWALASGAMYNYGLEKAAPNPPAPYLAWFTLFANAGMLLGALIGPLVSNWAGIRLALAIFAAVRLITGIIIAREK